MPANSLFLNVRRSTALLAGTRSTIAGRSLHISVVTTRKSAVGDCSSCVSRIGNGGVILPMKACAVSMGSGRSRRTK